MAQTIDNSVEGRLAELEAAVRSIRATNLTDLASAVDASGRYVPLRDLAFGQVAARAAGQLTMRTNAAAWNDNAPTLDVFVNGGRLRLDLAARLVVTGINLRVGMSYRVTGPTDEPSAAGPLVTAPDESRALLLKSNGTLSGSEQAAGVPDLVENLVRGWYRVTASYQLLGEQNTPEDTFAVAVGRRLFATPL